MPGGGVESGLRNTDHAFSSGAAWLLSEYVAGIRPTTPGFATFDIIPHPGPLNWVQGTMPTPLGGISIDYTLDQDEKLYDAQVTVPGGAVGRVAVPRLGITANVWLDDELVWTPAGPVGSAVSDDHYLYFPDVGSGTHTLAAEFDPGIADPDFDHDYDVDMEDFGHFQACLSGPGLQQTNPACADAMLDDDQDVDQDDFAVFQGCLSGANTPPTPRCDRP